MSASKEKCNVDLSDPNFYFGKGSFVLANGDSYNGDYGAHRRGLVWREGYGVYKTKDGQIYEGNWLDDEIVENDLIKITFSNGDQYNGCTIENKFSGPAVYILDSKLEVSCVFQENRPVGHVILIDLDGRTWTGYGAEDYALLLPDNHFYFFISESQGIGQMKSKYRKSEEMRQKKRTEKDLGNVNKDIPEKIFAKSTKTPTDNDFEKSQWYQRYLRYDTMFGTITEKIKRNESLTKEENNWYSKAKKNRSDVKKKRMREKLEKKKSSVDTSLLDSFYGEEFKTRWPIMKVARPSPRF